VRFGEPVGSVTQPSQANTNKPVGPHFRLPGHSNSDMVFLFIEKVVNKDKLVLTSQSQTLIPIKKCNTINFKVDISALWESPSLFHVEGTALFLDTQLYFQLPILHDSSL
jgi:hypothetical protein